MKRRPPPDLAELRRIYDYDPNVGVFRFRVQVGRRGNVGAVAGAKRVDGYIGIALGGKVYLAHHLAWYYVYEEWVLRLDHKNRTKSDNRINNLRLSTAPQNGVNNEGWNQSKRKNKYPKGVYLDPSKSKKPFAAIRIDGKLRILGYFDSVEAASKAYQIASRQVHGEFSPFKGER